MVSLGTALRPHAKKLMMLGAGELGKEVVIELQRFGVEVIAVDRYADAPAMHVAHRSYVLNMSDGAALRSLIEKEKPHLIVPEIEAIATDRRHSPLGGGTAWFTNLALSLCRHRRRDARRHGGYWPALCGQTRYEQFRERSKHSKDRG